MNKFFISFAAIITSGIFAYSYLREWVGHVLFREKLILKPTPDIDYPYFHSSEELYLRILFIFGLLFVVLLTSAVYFSIRQKWKWVYLSFVLTMLCILSVMINGAIK